MILLIEGIRKDFTKEVHWRMFYNMNALESVLLWEFIGKSLTKEMHWKDFTIEKHWKEFHNRSELNILQ